MNTGVLGTTVSKVPRAARADLTMHTSRVPLAFRLSLLVPSPPCIWLALDPFPLSSLGNFCPFPSQLVRVLFPLTPRKDAKHRQTDRRIILSATHALLDVNPSRMGLNLLCKDRARIIIRITVHRRVHVSRFTQMNYISRGIIKE